MYIILRYHTCWRVHYVSMNIRFKRVWLYLSLKRGRNFDNPSRVELRLQLERDISYVAKNRNNENYCNFVDLSHGAKFASTPVLDRTQTRGQTDGLRPAQPRHQVQAMLHFERYSLKYDSGISGYLCKHFLPVRDSDEVKGCFPTLPSLGGQQPQGPGGLQFPDLGSIKNNPALRNLNFGGQGGSLSNANQGQSASASVNNIPSLQALLPFLAGLGASDPDDGCHKLNGNNGEICLCSSDLCNGAVAKMITNNLMFLSLAAAIFIQRMLTL